MIEDRYYGMFSGGKFTAWPRVSEMVPRAIEQDTFRCARFWDWTHEHIIVVGIGETEEEAVADLAKKLEERPDYDPAKEPKYLADWVPG